MKKFWGRKFDFFPRTAMLRMARGGESWRTSRQDTMQRLLKNHGAYHGETIRIREVLAELREIARRNGWHEEVFYQQDGLEWLALQRPSRAPGGARSRIYLSAGIHGDEPAGPLAALELVRQNVWPEHAEVFLLPCLNPTGFEQNRRENGQGRDLNRDYRAPQAPETIAHVNWLEAQKPYALCVCLHEDWEAHGFYVYELNPEQKPSRAEAIIAAVAPVSPIDHSPQIDGRPAQGGIIRPELEPRTRPHWPEAFWLLQNKTRLSYTLEAPSDFPLPTRVKALVAGVKATLAGTRDPA